MSDPTSAPTRLLDDPTIQESLRHDLELASSHAPIAYNATAGLAAFERALAAAGASAGSTGAGVATGGRLLGWFIGAAVLIGGVGGAGWVVSQASVDHGVVAIAPSAGAAELDSDNVDAAAASQASSGSSETPAGARTSEAVAAGHALLGAEGTNPAMVHDPGQVEDSDPASDSSTTARPSSKSDFAEPASSVGSEAEQVNAARKALTHDPAKALALTQAAAQAFPDGAMVQEREGYAILALIALDRRTEADARAQTYLARWPKGPLSRRVRDALAN